MRLEEREDAGGDLDTQSGALRQRKGNRGTGEGKRTCLSRLEKMSIRKVKPGQNIRGHGKEERQDDTWKWLAKNTGSPVTLTESTLLSGLLCPCFSLVHNT